MKLSKWTYSIVNLGVHHHQSEFGKRQARLLNVIVSLSILVVLPTIIVFNASQKVYDHVYLGVGASVVCSVCWILSIRGKTMIAGNALIISIMLFIVVTTLVAEKQMAAPYTYLPLMIAIIHFKTGRGRNILLFLSIVAFASLNIYQIAYLPFEAIHYLPAIPTLVLFYIGFSFSEKEISRYQTEIEAQNAELTLRNKTIREQTEKLLELEREKHQHEILLKQKDLDTVIANNRLQKEIKEKLVTQLEEVDQRQPLKAIRHLILELKSQNESLNRISLLQDNLESINADFFDRLTSRHPNLNKKELQLCSYLRLGLSSKEIANLRGARENTVNVSKSRLREKFGLSSNAALQNYLLRY